MHTQFVELPVFDQERHPPETQIARRRDHNGTATNAVATGAHDREVSGQRGQPHGDHQQMTRSLIMTATCSCGGVELKAFGRPIVSSVCYCDDCQKGAGQIEALPNAGTVRDPDGGTAYILYRKDRIECSKGAELLRSYKVKETSVTNRVVATCCNSAVFVNFDRGPHWVSAYRARFHGELPPLQLRICTKFKPDGVVLPDDVPSYRRYPPGLVVKLLASRVAMLLGR
jgi:hypothetical protein